MCSRKIKLFLFLVCALIKAAIADGNQGWVCILEERDSGNTYDCTGFSTLPKALPKPNRVISLQMSYNNNTIEKLVNGSLLQLKLPKLKHLKLTNCKIRDIEQGAFAGGDQLAFLDLSKNNLEFLNPEVFKDLLKLESLDLESNPIQQFKKGSQFPHLNIDSLDLRNCSLNLIEPNLLENLKQLGWLFLAENEFTTLDWRVLSPLKSLHFLSLGDNPWHCDCHVGFLNKYILQRGVLGLHSRWSLPLCKTTHEHISASVTGKNWTHIRDELWICPPQINSFNIYNTTGIGQERKTFNFKCKFSGFPAPTISWLKNGQYLKLKSTGSGRIKANTIQKVMGNEFLNFTEEIESELVIENFKEEEDAGKYECFIFNLAGNSSKAIFLNFTKPKMPEAPISRTTEATITTEIKLVTTTTETQTTSPPPQTTTTKSESKTTGKATQNPNPSPTTTPLPSKIVKVEDKQGKKQEESESKVMVTYLKRTVTVLSVILILLMSVIAICIVRTKQSRDWLRGRFPSNYNRFFNSNGALSDDPPLVDAGLVGAPPNSPTFSNSFENDMMASTVVAHRNSVVFTK